jgi:predicted transcriptional regulator
MGMSEDSVEDDRRGDADSPSLSLILARIGAGIDAADNGRFATRKQVEQEFGRLRASK